MSIERIEYFIKGNVKARNAKLAVTTAEESHNIRMSIWREINRLNHEMRTNKEELETVIDSGIIE